jgi:ABC-type multidrug transport system fused ATPase/permease subunit
MVETPIGVLHHFEESSMLATFAVGQVLWSMLWFFLFFMWIMLLFMIFGDLFRDHETSGGMKVLWIVLLFAFPYLGAFIYIIARGKGMNERAMQQAKANEAAATQYIQQAAGTTSVSAELEKLVALKVQGTITEDEFATAKAKLLA